MKNLFSVAATAASLFAAAGVATAQSDPSLFGTVYNIGTVPPGSIFDVPGAVAGTQVGDGDGLSDEVFVTPMFLGGNTLGSDSQLNLFDGGEILGFLSAGPSDDTASNIEVNISGGSVGKFFCARSGSTVNISGGTVGSSFDANSGSTVNISGGTVGDFFDAFSGSTVTIAGGSVGGGFLAYSGSTVNISGGCVGEQFGGLFGSTVNISGGSVGVDFNAVSGSAVTIFGGAFELNGGAVSDLSSGFGASGTTDVFTGVVQDGSVFIFAGEASDDFAAGTTTLRSVAVAPSANPGVLSSGTFTKGVRAGETLTVTGDGVLGDNFAVVGGTLNIESGSVGEGLEVAFGEINISGGIAGDFFTIFSGSTVNISGGTVGDLVARSGSTVNISGGAIDGALFAFSGSKVNLIGSSFILDGVELTGLAFDEAFTINDRDVALTGVLADGSGLAVDLNALLNPFADLFDRNAKLTVTLVPTPCSVADLAQPFDVLNSSDINAFIAGFLAGDARIAELADPLTVTNASDINAFVAAFLAGCP